MLERGMMYRRIAADLRLRILAGELAPGASLPSEPTLADRYGVSRATVREALALLVEEGFIETFPGRGRRVIPATGEHTERPKTAYRRVMDGLRTRLDAGEFGLADKLPSETELMDIFRVSRNTVRRAYRELVYEGVVVVRHGDGAYPAFPTVDVPTDRNRVDDIERAEVAEGGPIADLVHHAVQGRMVILQVTDGPLARIVPVDVDQASYWSAQLDGGCAAGTTPALADRLDAEADEAGGA